MLLSCASSEASASKQLTDEARRCKRVIAATEAQLEAKLAVLRRDTAAMRAEQRAELQRAIAAAA